MAQAPLRRTLAALLRARFAPPAPAAMEYSAAAAAAAGGGLSREQVEERILQVVKNFQKVDASKVTPTSHFVSDLGLDSLDTVEVVMAFEDEFRLSIPDAEADKILSVDHAVDYVLSDPNAN